MWTANEGELLVNVTLEYKFSKRPIFSDLKMC